MARFLLMWLAFFCMTCLTIEAMDVYGIPPQFQAQKKNEVILEDGEERDRAFDESIITEEGRPPAHNKPTQTSVQQLYNRQRQRAAKSKTAPAKENDGESVSQISSQRVNVKLYGNFYTLSNWGRASRCCPAKQNYGCGTVRRRLPCFSHIINGRREWCCPFWPNTYVSYCNCQQCTILTPLCARQGYCYRRYTLNTCYAVCYRNNYWGVIRRFRHYLPSSCYCKAACCYA